SGLHKSARQGACAHQQRDGHPRDHNRDPYSISGHALESQKIYNFHQVEGYMVTGSEIDELEKVSMQQVNSLRTALESEIAALEAAPKRTEEEEERLGKLRHLH